MSRRTDDFARYLLTWGMHPEATLSRIRAADASPPPTPEEPPHMTDRIEALFGKPRAPRPLGTRIRWWIASRLRALAWRIQFPARRREAEPWDPRELTAGLWREIEKMSADIGAPRIKGEE